MRWKQWSLAILVLLLAAVIVAYGLGERIPAEHTTVAALTISAPPSRVWALISDVDSYPKWRTDLKGVEDLPASGTHQRWAEHYAHDSLSFVLLDSNPVNSRVVMMEPGTHPFDGQWTFELQPLDDGRTSVTITEHGHIFSPIFRFVAHNITGDDYQQKRFLNDLEHAVTSH
jgi:uncharacterized protein YndB with AHSA1/START domain